MPTAFMIRVTGPFAAGGLLPGADDSLGRAFVVALVALGVLVALLPRGRRRMATLPGALLVVALSALLLPAVIPEAPEEARSLAEFLVIASLLLALLRIGAVGICERSGLPVSRIVLDVFGWLLVGGALLTTLYNAGIKAGDLSTGSALITAVIGFALKETSGNVFAGLAIHAEHPFEVGDWIQYDPQPAHVGKVVEHWVRLFTDRFGQRDMVDGLARDRIWYALARHGIRIPVATHAVRLESPPADSPGAALERRVEYLGRIGLLEPLGTALLNRLAAGSEERLYASGERIVREDDPGASMFVIVSGRVEVTAVAAGRDRGAVLAALGPGDYFGEMSLMTGAPRVATVTAVEETRLIEVGKESFAAILAAEPALVEELGRALQRRIAERARAVAGTERGVPENQDILRKIREFFGS